ncbi:alpha/beta hydrolase [Streptomyces kaniharaensis]|uniref:Alpha/beta hydrolase n=1 Tax=Streptomyces kaniharaensis TaxID=212423 RepID=A0A6N7KQY5_9ACTN|nr:alpha/beta hydrolase [Streptomyces kaniharaensis]MQS12828.1 alpha/beta hydrolase [Streptomyces kaniharaensis]
MRISEFRNAKAEDRFRTAYEQTLTSLWPGPRTTLDIPTTFGVTRVYRTGPETGDPIVLLPGSGGNALMWHRYIDDLAENHPVIAVDTVGEPGASVQTSPIADGRDGAAWLDELLTALELTAAHVVGCSYGGWLAINHQIHHPGRMATLTLVDPAGLADVGRRFYTWLIAGGLASAAPRPFRPRLARLVGNSAILETELMGLVRASMGFRRALPLAYTFSDEELRSLHVPSLFLLGARSALHDSAQVADRIRRLAPSARVEIVPDAGHALPADQPTLVTNRILNTASQKPS